MQRPRRGLSSVREIRLGRIKFFSETRLSGRNNLPIHTFSETGNNLPHAIHQMALIKIGICECSNILLPDGYQVASPLLK